MILVNKQGLIFRLALSIGFASLLVGFIAAQVFYRFTYFNETETIHDHIKSLFNTVQTTAAVAGYLEDEGLAREVISGLASNKSVSGVAFISKKLSISTSDNFDKTDSIAFDLHSPFQADQQVGNIYIKANEDHIESLARKFALDNVKALAALALAVTLSAIFITYFLIARPMSEVAEKLNTIKPGKNSRIKLPSFHKGSELGMLVNDVNHLLVNVDQHLDIERSLRNELQGHEKRLRMLFENSSAPIVLMEPTGSILLYNKAFHRLLDNTETKLVRNYGPLLQDLFEDPQAVAKMVKLAFANNEAASGEFKLSAQADGKDVWVQALFVSNLTDEQKEYYQITLFDITKRVRELNQLNQQAFQDQLTQLMNRHGLEMELSRLANQQQRFALMLMDLNGFKPINDIYGHDCGDEILKFVGKELKLAVRRDDLVCRWGGDEFVIVMKEISSDQVKRLAKNLQEKIRQPYYLREHDATVSVGASMGVAFYPEDEIDIHSLLRLADKAMYAAKANKYKDKQDCLKIASDEEIYDI